MAETYEGKITGLDEWSFSGDPQMNSLISGMVAEAFNNSLQDCGSLWLTDNDEIGVHFYLNLNDVTAEVSWKRPLSEMILEDVESNLPGGPNATYPLKAEHIEPAKRMAQRLRDIADQVDAFMADQAAQRGGEQNKPETRISEQWSEQPAMPDEDNAEYIGKLLKRWEK